MRRSWPAFFIQSRRFKGILWVSFRQVSFINCILRLVLLKKATFLKCLKKGGAIAPLAPPWLRPWVYSIVQVLFWSIGIQYSPGTVMVFRHTVHFSQVYYRHTVYELRVEIFNTPSIPSHVPSNYSLPLNQVLAGCGHTAILIDNGKVLSFVDNRYGQPGGWSYLANLCNHPFITAHLFTNHLHATSTHPLTCYTNPHHRVQCWAGWLGPASPHVKSIVDPTPILLQYDDFNFVFTTAGIAQNGMLNTDGLYNNVNHLLISLF